MGDDEGETPFPFLPRRKQGLLILEEAVQAAPKLLKKFMELYPASLQEQSVVDLIARYKKKRG